MVRQRSRIPAVMMLLAVTAFGAGMVLARRGDANVAGQENLGRLQAAAALPGAHAGDWAAYGKALEAAGRLKDAIVAFDQALKLNGYERDALLGGGACRAKLGQTQAFYDFMAATNKVDPKAAVAIFSLPEAAGYLREARFGQLKSEADAGAMD